MNQNAQNNDTTHFGFEQVKTEEKSGMVRGVFNSVAGNYDLMNDAMSLGAHRLWKQHFVGMIAPKNHESLLDVAGGTGDIAFAMHKKAPNAAITICDINEQMLREGRNRQIDGNFMGAPIQWVTGDAQTLPCPDRQYDSYSIAFGIRNVTNVQVALEDAYRVLKFGGRFFCLEFTPKVTAALQPIYERYSFNAIPKMGKLLAKDEESYQYLVESIRQFPNRETFASMIEKAGFTNVKHQGLSGGIVAIHSGWKI